MKRLQWLLVLIPVVALAQMEISTSERVSMQLIPDVLEGTMNFDEQAKEADAVKRHLNALVAEVKRQDPQARYCRGGGYRISPLYSYKNQKQEFTGYGGSLSFSCEFESIEQYNALISAVESVAASEVRKHFSPLRWRISDKVQETVQVQLRTALMEKVFLAAKKFSADTQMACEPVSVRIVGSQTVIPMQMRSMAVAESVPTQSPIQGDEESFLEANVDYRCSARSDQEKISAARIKVPIETK